MNPSDSTAFDLAIGNNIRRAREAAGLSLAELSRRLRERGVVISSARLSRMEAGRSTVYSYDAFVLSNILGVTCDQLIPPPDQKFFL